jgi:hypothetical protein
MLVFAPALIHQQPVDKPTLELYQQRFVLRTSTELLRVPILENPELPPAVMYRRGDAYAVWDERGLTIRNDDWSYITRMPEIATSPKLFTRAEILENNRLAKDGTRTLEATSLSGSMRIGPNAYFLLRWDSNNGTPWNEALVSVDLTLPKPKARLVGKFNGISSSREQLGDKLFILSGKLSVVTSNNQDWGVSSYDPEQESFSFRKLGTLLESFKQTSNLSGYFVERRQGSGTLAGSVEFSSGARREIWSTAGTATFVDTQSPEILMSTGQKTQLYWPESGSTVEVPDKSVVKRLGKYVVVWSPSEKPTQATAFIPEGWKVIATWKR